MTPDFSCEKCRDSLPWYVAHLLSNGEWAAMERHLASCERCRAALEEWREIATALRRADESIPLDNASLATWANISRRLEEQTNTYKADERTTMHPQDDRPDDHDRSIPNIPAPAASVSTVARPHGRIRAMVGLVAVVALIALSAGIFTFLGGRGTPRSGNAASTPQSSCAPSQATVSLPAHTMLGAIAPLGTDDGWAVGGISDPQKPDSAPSAVMLRLQHCHWAPVGTPIPNASLTDISMVSADEGWAVGVTYALDTMAVSNGPTKVWDYDQPLVLHYTQGSWQTVKVAAAPKTTAEKVKMVSASEGWMLLYNGKHPATINGAGGLTYGYALLHYQSGTWTNIPMSFRKPTMVVSDLDARQPGEVWLVGQEIFGPNNTQPAFAAHYYGGTWTTSIGAEIGADASLDHVNEISPNDVWAGGNGLYHFDGSRWSKASIHGTLPKVSGKYQLPANYMPRIGEIAMLSPTQGWAFPDFGEVFSYKFTEEPALRYDHGAWQWATPRIQGAPLVMPIPGFARLSPTQGWALGLYISPNGNDQETRLLYYDAGKWGVVRQQP